MCGFVCEDWLAELDGPSEVLNRLAEPDIEVDASSLASIYLELAQVEEKNWPDPPEHAPRSCGFGHGARGLHLKSPSCCYPHHRPLFEDSALFGPAELAEVLDVRSSAQQLAGVRPETKTSSVRPVPAVVRELVPEVPETYFEHDQLVVEGVDVPWWVDESGSVHAATTDGLARGLAWASGQWPRRWELAAVLAEPELAQLARDERHFD